MSDFKQAIKWLKEGKNVRRKSWENIDFYIESSNDFFMQVLHEGRVAGLSIMDFEATDWEVYEEEYYECAKCGRGLEESDMGKKCRFCGEWTYHHECVRKGKKESTGECLLRLGTDGHLWAEEFIKIMEEKKFKIDVELMVGWFCNAIEAGRAAK